MTASEERVENRFKFNGQQYDPISQQYYLRARYYNPVMGRFTQEDTYQGDGLNLYVYCANNPICFVDPSGNTISCPHDAERIMALMKEKKANREDVKNLSKYLRDKKNNGGILSPEEMGMARDLGISVKGRSGASEGESGTGKIRTQAELDALAADPAHGGKIGAKSIAERDVGLGLESQGKVNTLIRDPSGSAEFIDTVTGQKWDVKAFNSQYAPKGYNLDDAMTNIKKSLAAKENVMLDTRNLTVTDLQELISEIAKQGLSDKVLTWP